MTWSRALASSGVTHFCSMMPQPSAVMTHKYTPCSHTHQLHTHSAPQQPLLTSIPSKQPRSLSNAPTDTTNLGPCMFPIKITHKSSKGVGDAVEEDGWSHFVRYKTIPSCTIHTILRHL